MAMAVAPMGMTSKIHHTAAIRKSPMAIRPCGGRGKCLPAGSTASAKSLMK